MSFATNFLNRTARRRRPTGRSNTPMKVRPFAEPLETRNLLSKTVLGSEHVHFEMNFASGNWQKFDLLDDTHGVPYKPNQVILYIGPQDLTTQGGGLDFVGAGAGNSFWETPLNTNAQRPYTSVAVESETIPSNTFDLYQPNDPRISRVGEWITLSMVNVQGPGYVSMWQDAQIPLNQWWMSSYDGGQTFASAIFVEPGGHIHVHWGFTAAGTYKVQFQASAFYGGNQVTSNPVTLTFAVDAGPAPSGTIPQPNVADGPAAIGTALAGVNQATRAVSGAPAAQPASTTDAAFLGSLPPGVIDALFGSSTAGHTLDPVSLAVVHGRAQTAGGWADLLSNEGVFIV
jgi:surface-anchored protein